jgi:hypothetical protein
LSVLLPGYKKIVSDFKDAKKAEMEEKLKGAGGDDPYIQFRALADELRAKDQKYVKEKPWRQQIEDQESAGGKLLKGGTASFKKQNRVLLDIFAKLEGR